MVSPLPAYPSSIRVTRHRRGRRGASLQRRGWALLDVIIGSIILAVGLAAIISLAGRSLAMQQRAEQEIVAAHLLDGILNEVLAMGPVDWASTQPPSGHCQEPFEDWRWEVEVTKQGLGDAYRVMAIVFDAQGREFAVDTLMAPRLTDDEEPDRAPRVPIDRNARYDELR